MSIKILLVEDNPADADFLQELLEDSVGIEWQLTWVEFLSSAFIELNKITFDIVLLDLSLPDSHGLETLTRLQETAPNTPMVVMTGLADEAIALEAVRLGSQDYLVKGQINTQLLTRTLRYAIERYQTLHLLRDNEQRFRAIFNSSFQLTKLLNPQGVIIEINQTALHFAGLKLEEIIGRPLWEIPIWGSLKSIQEQLKEDVEKCAQGNFIRRELDLFDTFGQNVTVDFSMKPVKNDYRQIVLIIAEAHDITERKRAELEILKSLQRERELSELRAQFVTMVSHEFRTPLTTIQLSSGLLQSYSAKWTEEKKNNHFQKIKTAIKRMTELLEDILVVGKMESQTLECQPVEINLEQFCHEIIENLTLNDSNQHTINLFSNKSNFVLPADPKLLRQMINNLLSNAIKYSPGGTSINLEINCKNDEVILQVQDKGIGIPQADKERIFDTFQRAGNVGNISGTGLGLAIIKRAVELHKGKIYMQSQEGVGTTFTVTLPLQRN
jgi:PAS domain S-box-containing protein